MVRCAILLAADALRGRVARGHTGLAASL